MPFLNRIGSGATKKFGFGAGVKPGAPTIGTATRGDQQVSVAFTPPDALGTGTPTYTATSSPGGFTAVGFSSPLVVTGLANGTAYTFTVKAENPFGFSISDASNSVTPAGLPGSTGTPVASLPATYGNTTAALTWTAASANGSAITDYIVQYSSNSGSSWTTFADGTSTTTSTTVTGLTNGTAYIFRVAAVNAIGTGSYSGNSNSVTPLFGKIATPVVSDIAETTSSIPLCYDNYASQSQDDGYVYNYYDYNVVPNDQSGVCHGWTGLGENVNRYTKVYLSKTGWANSDSIYLEETTNETPVTTTTTVDPCAGCTARDTFVGLNCDGQYLQGVYTDGCCGEYVRDRALIDGWCGYYTYPCSCRGCTAGQPNCGFDFKAPGGGPCFDGSFCY
jgi:hypothetical protein